MPVLRLGQFVILQAKSLSTASEYVRPGAKGFLPGNPGKPKGAKDKRKRLVRNEPMAVKQRRELAKTALEQVHEHGTPHIADVMAALVTSAKGGDVQAALGLLRHLAPPSPRSVVRDQGDLALLAPEQRLAEISARTAAGLIPLEHAVALQSLASAEISAKWITPLRSLLRDLRSGSIGLEQLARRLIDLSDAIDGDAAGDEGAADSTFAAPGSSGDDPEQRMVHP